MRPEFRLSLLYCIGAMLWIAVSGWLVNLLFPDGSAMVALAEVAKGWLFAGVTTLLLYSLLRREFEQRRRVEAELHEKQRLYARLEHERRLREMRGRFISTMSHEFRTPLASIAVTADKLARYYPRMTDESRGESIAGIRTEVDTLLTLLDDTLALLKREDLSYPMQVAPLELALLCRAAIDRAARADHQRHPICLTCPDTDLVFPGDAKLLAQLFDNLMSNALKYSPEGSEVQVTLVHEGDEAVLTVRDQGIGIPPDNLARLFDAFYRADNVGDVPGTGLGLAISRQAVELHGGSISIDSAVGAGTTVVVRLPMRQSEAVPNG